MINKFEKLFTSINMTWKKVILFALIIAVITATFLIIPFTIHTSLVNIGTTVEALDRNGNKVFYEGEELLARAFCHEIDHLDGILYIDKAEEVEELE